MKNSVASCGFEEKLGATQRGVLRCAALRSACGPKEIVMGSGLVETGPQESTQELRAPSLATYQLSPFRQSHRVFSRTGQTYKD